MTNSNILEADNDFSPVQLAQNHFIELAMQNILQGYQRMKELQLLSSPDSEISHRDLNRISQSINFILKLIEEFEGGSSSQGKKGHLNAAEQIFLTVDNKLPAALPPKKFPISVSKNLTIGELRSIIAGQLTPPVAPDEIMMVTKGSILDNNSTTINDKKIQSNQTIMCMKNKPADDYITEGPILAIMGPQKPPVSEAEINQKVEELLNIFPDFDIPLLEFILQKKSYNTEEVAITMLDPSNVDTYRAEMETAQIDQNKKNNSDREGNSRAGGQGTARSLSATIANQSEYFELFFQLLKLPINELQNKVWNLLSILPLNAKLYERIRGIFENNDSMQINWNELLDSDNSARLLYSLQIMSTFINCTTLDENEQALEVIINLFYSVLNYTFRLKKEQFGESTF